MTQLPLKLLNKAGEMPTLAPPDDESIKTFYVRGLDSRIMEQDLRDHFYAHGEIESIRLVIQRACAFVTYITREAAEKATKELSNKLVIKGPRLKLLWGKPQAPKPEGEASAEDEAATLGVVAHAGLLPRALISQQQQPQPQPQPQPLGTTSQHYFNIPAPERMFYPSMDPQRMGALVPNLQEGSGTEKQQQQLYLHGQYPQPPPYYQPSPPYGYLGHPPPAYCHQYPPPYQLQPQPPTTAAQQQYQAPSTSSVPSQ